MHLRGLKLAAGLEEVANRMAALTPGFTGADISNICNEAAIVAARRNKTAVDLVDFEVGAFGPACVGLGGFWISRWCRCAVAPID